MIHIGTVYLFGTIYESHEFMPSFLKSLFSTTIHRTSLCLSNATATHVFSTTFHGIISLNNILNARAHTNTFLAKQIHKFCVLSCHKFFLSSKYKEKNKSRSEATTVHYAPQQIGILQLRAPRQVQRPSNLILPQYAQDDAMNSGTHYRRLAYM